MIFKTVHEKNLKSSKALDVSVPESQLIPMKPLKLRHQTPENSHILVHLKIKKKEI